MKLTKNQFILNYNPTKFESFDLCLVDQDSKRNEDKVSVITFSRINHGFNFEPMGEEVISKDRILMTDLKFTMTTEICPITSQEKCKVNYGYSEFTLKKKITSAIDKIKKNLNKKGNALRGKLRILGKKSDLEISRKIKTSKNQEAELLDSTSKKKKAKAPKFRRGKENPLITTLVESCEQTHSSSSRFNIDCCIQCNNKELIRAIKTSNRTLFDAILKSSKTISSIRVSQGQSMLDDTFTLSMDCDSPYYFKKLMELTYGKNADITKKRFYRQLTSPRLSAITTGSNDKYAYGKKTRQVALGRGNRQGINALCDSFNSYRNPSIQMITFLRKITRTPHVHELIFSNPNLFREMQRRLYLIVESGNVDMAAFIAKIILRNGGYGFSQYHLLALTLDFDPKPDLEKLKEKKKNDSKIKVEAPPMAVPSKRRANKKLYRRFNHRAPQPTKGKPIPFNKPFLTKAEQMELLMKMRKANVTKKAYDNLSITPLHCVCINPNPSALKHFLDVGDNLYVYDLELRKPVHYAACSSTPENLKLLAERGVDLRDSDKIRKTPLMYACQYGRLANVKFILEHSQCNINQKCRIARGPIHYAAEYGHLELLKYLHEKGADLGITGPNRQTVLSLACMMGHYEMAEYLLDAGVSQIKSDKYGKSPLVHAVQNGHLKLVNLLLMRGALFDKGDSSKNTPLHYAGAFGNYEMIKLLCLAGADVNAVNSWNMTPITVTLLKNHFRCVKEFLDLPLIDVNCQDNHGLILLMNALSLFSTQSFEFSHHLIHEKSADLSIKNFSGNNVFHLLAMFNYNIKFANLKFQDYKKYMKLKKSSKVLYERFFNLYIDNKIDINEKNVAGDTPLSIALREKNFLFLDLITKQDNLNVDHLVHDKSELHYFKSIIFAKNAPELLERIIKKSQNIQLLMQLYDLDNGYNCFHSILNTIVTKYYGNLNTIRAGLNTKYQNYLRFFNANSYDKLQQENMNIEEDDDDEEEEEEEEEEEVKMIEEEIAGDEDEVNFRKIMARIITSKKLYIKKPIKKNLLKFIKAKSEYYQPKYNSRTLKLKELEIKDQILNMFNTFEGFGYDFSQKVRLYKQPIKPVVIAEQINHYNPYGRSSAVVEPKPRIPWKNKKYTINKDAKSSVFHIVMKSANMFLFDYFFDKLPFVKNECNFLGNSLIHNLVQNYKGASPKMDLKIFNEDYDRIKQKKLEKEKKVKEKNNESFAPGLASQKLLTAQPVQFGYKMSTTKRTIVRKNIASRKRVARNTFQSSTPIPSAPVKINTKLEEQTLQVLSKLLTLGEDPDLHNKKREYPIIKVCQDGGSDMLHLMVSSKTNLNVLDRKGNNPLLFFAKKRDLHSCEYLLANRANINFSDKKGRNALHWSLNMTTPENSNNFDLEEILIKNGIDLNQRDVDWKPPIFYLFTKIGNEFINEKLDPIEIFSYMLSLKVVDLEAKDNNGNRLIHFCAQRGAYLCAIYLLRAGVNVNVFNYHQNSALNISILNKQNDVSIILLQHNAEVNCSVQLVDYESLKKYKKKLKENKKKERESSKNKILEEDNDESEEEEEEEELELEDEEGLVEEAVIGKFREDEESEDEDDWHDYLKGMSGGPQKKQKAKYELEDEFSEDEDQEQNQAVQGGRHLNRYKMNTIRGQQSRWQIQQMKTILRQSLAQKNKEEADWKALVKLSKNNFVTGKESQFNIALKHAMLSVNFLLIDFNFNLGRAIMDTLSLKNWAYTKTLLNKKLLDSQFEFTDNKGRNAFHYLAFFGSSLDVKTLEFFITRFTQRGIDLLAKDCLQRKPIHYAALSGNLAFIHLVKETDPKLQEKDIFGNTLFSLYLRSHSIEREKLETFVNDYKNDINVIFKVSEDDFVKEVESFSEFATENKNVEAQLKKLLKSKLKELPWFDSEKKFREGQMVPQVKANPFKFYSTLIFAGMKKQDLVLTENLIQIGANLNLKDQKGETILAKAIYNNDLKLLEVLKKYSSLIDFTAVDNSNRSYLHMVVSPYCSGSFKNVKLLEFLLPFVDLSCKDRNGRTALSYAQSQDDELMSSTILSHAGSSSKAKKLQKEAERSIVALPSTVVNSSDIWETDYNFYDDYETLIEDNEREEQVETKNMTYKELAEKGLRPKPDERVEGELIVVEDEVLGRHLNVMLVKVKIAYSYYSQNLFYKMQLLYETNRKLFILFTNWGRVGTTGQFQQTPFFNQADACKEFHKIFKEKTRNEWAKVGEFEKKYRKYNLLNMARKSQIKEVLTPFDYNDPNMPESELNVTLQSLMKALTDNKMYQLAYSSFQVDKQHLPFGYLDRDTLIKAKNLLKDISSLINKQTMNSRQIDMNKRMELADEINAKTSDYYELIPSSQYKETAIPSFCRQNIQAAVLVVKNLLDFEIVSKMLCGAQLRQKVIHPFDYCLRSIGVRMASVDLRSEEAKILLKYITNSSQYKQDNIVQNIFAVSRPEEEENFISLDNRRLLWHGTKTENLVSILHNGLKISPPSAEHTGSMFGNGIYFADFFDKSLNYCANHYFNESNRSMYIMLCEVSLGNMQKLYQAKDVKRLKSVFNSVKGSGRNSHVKEQNLVLNNGCMVPLGKLRNKTNTVNAKMFGSNAFGRSKVRKTPRKKQKAKKLSSAVPHWKTLGKGMIGLPGKSKPKKAKYYSLNYNEFVIYNTNQVKIRYLIEINKNIVPT